MKIFDCFSYWDEDLLLDVRLNVMNNFVDYFVIVEGNKTWQNNSKKLKFDLNKFKKFKDKIIYVSVEDMPDGDNPYERENFQRNCISRGIKKAEDDDLIIIDDINPVAPIHLLIIPKKLITKLSDSMEEDRDVLGHLMLVAKKVAKDLNLDDTFRIVNNNGAKAGQSVFHLHLHLLSGRSLSWPPG